MEKWKDINGYEGIFQVSSYGRVRSLEREIVYYVKGKYPSKRVLPQKMLKPYKHKKGYCLIDLCYKGGKYKSSVHRLVADAFIPNPENKPCVGHWDCDPSNNCVENLYWCTYEENNNNPITNERQRAKVVSKETKKKMSESQKKRFENEEPWMKGKHHSQVSKDKISDKNSKTIYQYTLDDKLVGVYKNSVIAAKETGLSQSEINRYAHGKYFSKLRNKWYYKNTYKNYKWSFKPL